MRQTRNIDFEWWQKAIKTDKREALLAATPPLEAIKLLLSAAMTEGIGFKRGKEEEGMQLEVIDIKSAYLQAEAKRDIYIHIYTRYYLRKMVQKGNAQNWTRQVTGQRTPRTFWKLHTRRRTMHGNVQ